MEPETDAPPPAPNAALPAFIQSLAPAQRAIESIIIAVVTSTGLYLIGSVYTEAYFNRLSIDATSLDLAPPYIALQSAHVVSSLLEYPFTLLVFYAIYRLLGSRFPRLRSWYDAAHGRFGRLFLLIVNLLIVSPLVISAFRAVFGQGSTFTSSVLGEVSELMATVALVLLVYAIWLSVGPRLTILQQVRQRRILPIALLFTLYLMDALIATAHGAVADAELLMLGAADSAIEISFTMADGVQDILPNDELILVIARQNMYFVVERQRYPPSVQPVAYMIPFNKIDSARLQRVNPGAREFIDLPAEMGLATAPAGSE